MAPVARFPYGVNMSDVQTISSGRPPIGRVVVTALALLLLAGALAYPSVSAYGLLTAEPVNVTITSCHNGSGLLNAGGCYGTWTAADGTVHRDKVTSESTAEPGETESGYAVLGKGRLSTRPWLLDVVVGYPVAIAYAALLLLWRRRMRAKDADTEPSLED